MTTNHATSSSSFYHRCGHLCGLPKRDECCQCSDTRPHQDHGYILSSLSQTRLPKSATYCPSCQRAVLRKQYPNVKQHDYFTQQLLLHQQRIIKAQEQDLQITTLLAQRMAYLENLMRAKDAEIQHLQKALTGRR